jgi:hypothetical protein
MTADTRFNSPFVDAPDPKPPEGIVCDVTIQHPSCRMKDHQKPRFRFIPAFYACYFSAMARVARECGYALTMHGSMERDLDVVAVPWIDEAIATDELIKALARECQMVEEGAPLEKPHGRLAYVLRPSVGSFFYVDLSVIPRATGKGWPVP